VEHRHDTGDASFGQLIAVALSLRPVDESAASIE
jgi:hypothetical protein